MSRHRSSCRHHQKRIFTFKLTFIIFTQIFVKFPNKFWGDEEWIIHAHERRGYFPVFMNAEAEGLFPTGTNMLVGFVVDEEARRVEHQPDWETKAEIEQVGYYLAITSF